MTKRVRVLLVEDEVVVSMLVEDMLLDLGFSVVGPAASIAEALSILAQESPDCAILDVNVGGSYIYPVADALRLRSIPYAFATGYGTAALRKDDAAVPVLQKPFRADDLGNVIGVLVPPSSPE